MADLTAFEGQGVAKSGIEMPGASGGLNKALAIDALEMHHGATGVVAIEYEVVKVRFDPIKDSDQLERVHVLRVTNATSVPPQLVEEALAEQARRVEEAAGLMRLDFDGDEDPADTDQPEPLQSV